MFISLLQSKWTNFHQHNQIIKPKSPTKLERIHEK